MKLKNAYGDYLKLTVAGYQFPQAKPDETYTIDANWLNMRLDAVMDSRSWSANDPCMTTWDLGRLADWLDSLGLGGPRSHSRCTFDEPTIFFEFVAVEGVGRLIRVYLEERFRPPWRPSRGVGTEDLWMDFPLAEIDLQAASASLRAQLQTIPVRTLA